MTGSPGRSGWVRERANRQTINWITGAENKQADGGGEDKLGKGWQRGCWLSILCHWRSKEEHNAEIWKLDYLIRLFFLKDNSLVNGSSLWEWETASGRLKLYCCSWPLLSDGEEARMIKTRRKREKREPAVLETRGYQRGCRKDGDEEKDTKRVDERVYKEKRMSLSVQLYVLHPIPNFLSLWSVIMEGASSVVPLIDLSLCDGVLR